MPTDLVQEIAAELGEADAAALQQITAVVDALGEETVRALLAETNTLEESGGMTIPDGTRRRTKGGVFFFLARRRLPRAERRAIFMGPFGPPQAPQRPRPAVTQLPRRPQDSAAPERGRPGPRGAWVDARRGGAAPALRPSRLVVHDVSEIAPPPPAEDTPEPRARMASYVAPELFEEPVPQPPRAPEPVTEGTSEAERPRRRIITLPTAAAEPVGPSAQPDTRVTRRSPRAPSLPSRRAAGVAAEASADSGNDDPGGEDDDPAGSDASSEADALLDAQILAIIRSSEVDVGAFRDEARELVRRYVTELIPLLEAAMRREALQTLASAASGAPRRGVVRGGGRR
ncbi:MAG: hypothetical protein IT376_08420 [Polyangiaceae bacterium]|nr:hypothetical protein [Polyangiaceae bacterium]